MKTLPNLSIRRVILPLLVMSLFANCKKEPISTQPATSGSASEVEREGSAISGLSQTKTATLLNYNLKGIFITNYPYTTLASSVAANDNKYAFTSKLTSQGAASLLALQGFQFNIPANATIEGIAVKARRFKTGKGEVKDRLVRLVMRRERADLPEWWEWYGPYWANPNNFPAVESEVNFSQPANGIVVIGDVSTPYQWTPARINDLYFGVVFQTNAITGTSLVINYDYVEIKVQYSIP